VESSSKLYKDFCGQYDLELQTTSLQQSPNNYNYGREITFQQNRNIQTYNRKKKIKENKNQTRRDIERGIYNVQKIF